MQEARLSSVNAKSIFSKTNLVNTTQVWFPDFNFIKYINTGNTQPGILTSVSSRNTTCETARSHTIISDQWPREVGNPSIPVVPFFVYVQKKM